MFLPTSASYLIFKMFYPKNHIAEKYQSLATSDVQSERSIRCWGRLVTCRWSLYLHSHQSKKSHNDINYITIKFILVFLQKQNIIKIYIILLTSCSPEMHSPQYSLFVCTFKWGSQSEHLEIMLLLSVQHLRSVCSQHWRCDTVSLRRTMTDCHWCHCTALLWQFTACRPALGWLNVQRQHSQAGMETRTDRTSWPFSFM